MGGYQAIRSKGIHETKFQLLSNVSKVFTPGVHTTLRQNHFNECKFGGYI